MRTGSSAAWPRRGGIPLDPARDKARTYALYLDLIKGRLTALPGVRDFVATCRTRGLALAVASSADEIKVNGNLDEIGLPPSTFDVVVNGSEVAKKKPAPDIFLEACRRLGAGAGGLPGDRGRARGRRRRQGRRLPLPGRHHLVPRRKARRRRRRLGRSRDWTTSPTVLEW